MRFITEFELDRSEVNDDVWVKNTLNIRQIKHQNKIGRNIADAFGWGSPAKTNHFQSKLEIEAFPMDKWVEFKEELLTAIKRKPFIDGEEIEKILQELESFGKPEDIKQ